MDAITIARMPEAIACPCASRRMRSFGQCCAKPLDKVPADQNLYLKFTRGGKIAFATVRLFKGMDADKLVAAFQKNLAAPMIADIIADLHWKVPAPYQTIAIKGL